MSIERPVPGVTVTDQPDKQRTQVIEETLQMGDTKSFPSQKHGATPKSEPSHPLQGTESTATAHPIFQLDASNL
jgi:hypothetical protein